VAHDPAHFENFESSRANSRGWIFFVNRRSKNTRELVIRARAHPVLSKGDK
jgi:hypothetical protein